MVATAGTSVYQECTGGGGEIATGVDGPVTTAPVTETCTTVGGAPGWVAPVAIALLLAYLALQVWTAWRLTRRR